MAQIADILTIGFIIAHAVSALLAYQMIRRGNKLFILMTALHLAAIPLVFVFIELVSLISFPLIMVTLIAFVLEDKPERN
ncbi:hypothetical protein HY989_05050 [Candidatus Micrarchaeota archaeon]|nr:hypothetical protein [Candidatus Micrarchaeota archaeon]